MIQKLVRREIPVDLSHRNLIYETGKALEKRAGSLLGQILVDFLLMRAGLYDQYAFIYRGSDWPIGQPFRLMLPEVVASDFDTLPKQVEFVHGAIAAIAAVVMSGRTSPAELSAAVREYLKAYLGQYAT